MLDTVTLRVAFGVVGFCVLVLFYGVTYRTTRSAYSGLWCVSLGLFLVSALLYLFNGTPAQAVANPLGNAIAVLGAGCVWAAARSLHAGTGTLPWWQLALPTALVLVASFLDDPAHDVWTGGAFFLAGMAAMLGLSTYELALVVRRPTPGSSAQVRFAVWSLAVTSGLVAVFYLLRGVAFVAVGPDDIVFRAGFGSQVTTLLTMVLLVVVTFSMAALSHEQQTSLLREQATFDALTGTLNRSEFLRRAEAAFATSEKAGSRPGVVVVADLDGFKELNDTFGHAAGDQALSRFAASCREVVGSDGLVGRLGGDEFALLIFEDGSPAEEVAEAIRRTYADAPSDQPTPTVSFGIAPIDAVVGLADSIIRADVALYQAKAAGRDRVARHDGAAG